MTKALAVLAAVAFGLSLSMSVGAADKTLAEIHGSAWPKSERIRREGAVQGLPR